MNNVLKKHGDSITKQGTKIKQHVQTTTQAAYSSLEKDYVSVELEPETEALDEISQQEREEQAVQATTTMPTHNSDEEAQPMISTMEESALFEYPTRLSDTVAAVNAKHEENEENEKKDDDEDEDDDDNSAGGGASDADVDGSGSGSDSEDWEDSGDEAWPVSNTRYAPVGDYQSRVSNPKGSTRLATEFTLGAGFHHLNVAGAKHMFGLDHNAGTILPCDRDQKLVQYNEAALELMKANKLQGKGLKVSKSAYLDKVLLITDAPHAIRLYIGDEDGVSYLCILLYYIFLSLSLSLLLRTFSLWYLYRPYRYSKYFSLVILVPDVGIILFCIIIFVQDYVLLVWPWSVMILFSRPAY